MLGRVDGALLQRLALAHLGQPARILILGVVVAAFLVELEEAVEFHHGAVGAQVERAGDSLDHLQGIAGVRA